MSDSVENPKSEDPLDRVEEFFGALRNAISSNGSPEARASAADACRAVLNVLEPPTCARNGPPPATPNTLGGVVAAVSALPREQILELASGALRSLFSSKPLSYRTAPVSKPGAPVTSRAPVPPRRRRAAGGGA